MKRNGYIDVIKLLFAIIIAEFHWGSGIFAGGRVAVEGFFIISGFLMMKSIEREGETRDLASSTLLFMWRKYKALFYFLLPAILVDRAVYSIHKGAGFLEVLERLPLAIFDLFPLRNAGYEGSYVLGISWYLSAMFIALAILYPLTRKFGRSFTLTVCPLISLLGYGLLSHFYGSLAVQSEYLPETVINAGLLRGLAGCALGCVAYEIGRHLSKKSPNTRGRVIFTVAELSLFAYLLYTMHTRPKSSYDYLLVYVIFALLLIGINDLSYTSYLWRGNWTKPLGVASTLIVLTHYPWAGYLKSLLGGDAVRSYQVIWYILGTALSSIIVYALSLLLKWLFSRLSRLKIWKVED